MAADDRVACALAQAAKSAFNDPCRGSGWYWWGSIHHPWTDGADDRDECFLLTPADCGRGGAAPACMQQRQQWRPDHGAHAWAPTPYAAWGRPQRVAMPHHHSVSDDLSMHAYECVARSVRERECTARRSPLVASRRLT
ncbi:hypothetical protein SEVIR_5G437502v4 [Setaria viridis]